MDPTEAKNDLDMDLENADRGDEFEEEELEDSEEELEEDESEEEEDSDDEEEDSDDEDEEEDDSEEPKAKDIRIPKARFDQAQRKKQEKIDALQAQLDKLQSQLSSQEEDTALQQLEEQLDEAETKYEDALVDGKIEEARALRKEIRGLERKISTAISNQTASQVRKRTVGEVAYNSTLALLESQYPAINPDHEDHDPDIEAEVADLNAAFQARGDDPAKALKKAVRYVLGDPESRAEKDTSKLRTERNVKVRRKNLKRMKKQPASLSSRGKGGSKAGKSQNVDISRLRPSHLEKMDKAELAKLRGDTLE